MLQTENTKGPSMPATNRSRGRRSNRTASTRSRSPARPRKPDAIRMLKDDHQRVKKLFDQFERTRGDARKERLAETICEELKLHAKLEEELFYPAVREAIDDADLMDEAEVEHGSAKTLIRQIEASSASAEKFDAMVVVLGEYIKHHVKEEEGEMFKQARRSGVDLAALGEEMQKRKRELTGEKGPIGSFVAAVTGGR